MTGSTNKKAMQDNVAIDKSVSPDTTVKKANKLLGLLKN